MNDTTFRGDVAELMAAAELVRRGYVVSRPLTNGAPYDLLVDNGDAIIRVQVKRACRLKNGTLRVRLSTSKYHRGRKMVRYVGLVDCLMAVECERVAFFVFSGDDLQRFELALRDAPAKNNQRARTRDAALHDIDSTFPVRRVVGDAGVEPATFRV